MISRKLHVKNNNKNNKNKLLTLKAAADKTISTQTQSADEDRVIRSKAPEQAGEVDLELRSSITDCVLHVWRVLSDVIVTLVSAHIKL